MHSSIQSLAGAVLGAVAFAVPLCGMACSPAAPPDAEVLKKMMAKEIAFRLGVGIEQVPLHDITAPALHCPLAPEADGSGLAARHFSAGFRIALATRQRGFATMAGPYTAAGAGSRARKRIGSGFYNRFPWAGVRPDFWRAPKPRAAPQPDYSGYIRWPEYATESDLAAAVPDPDMPQRWPQFAQDPAFLLQPRSTLSLRPAETSQGFCRYEGVAVVLGHDASSPVAVNFTQGCD